MKSCCIVPISGLSSYHHNTLTPVKQKKNASPSPPLCFLSLCLPLSFPLQRAFDVEPIYASPTMPQHILLSDSCITIKSRQVGCPHFSWALLLACSVYTLPCTPACTQTHTTVCGTHRKSISSYMGSPQHTITEERAWHKTEGTNLGEKKRAGGF